MGIREKSQPQVISLLDDSTDDEMEIKKPIQPKRYSNKGRQYNSRRNTTNNNNRRRRSRRIANKNENNIKHNNNNNNHNHSTTPNVVQNPIIINGCNDDISYNDQSIMEVHGSQSPAFMPSVHYNNNQKNNNGNGNPTILDTMDTMKNGSTFSLDTHDTTMDMDDEYTWNNNDNSMNNNHNTSPSMQMDEFNMIGFNDDFSTLGVMGALSRNSSDSFNQLNGTLHLNSSFADPNFQFETPKKINSMNHMM